MRGLDPLWLDGGRKPRCELSQLPEMQIDGHLDLVTATLARPYMTDFAVAHVCRRLWRDQ